MTLSTPKGLDNGPAAWLCNPFGVEKKAGRANPGCAGATLGCGMQPLRGRKQRWKMKVFLETERLLIREFREDDADHLLALDSDP
jgi:hypothetical protein